jgi:prepilin-type N-terminal cleavage/methylation domain-containing protein
MTESNGFTLVELLAAMVAGSLLLVAVGAATGSLTKEARKGATAKDASKVARLAPTLDRLVTSLQPGEGDNSGIEISTKSLSGDIEPPDALGPVGTVHMALDVRREPGGDALVLTLTPIGPATVLPKAVSKPIKLVDGFKSISFDTPGASAQAYDLSDGPIVLHFEGAKSVERTLAFSPKATTSGTCRFDPISLACR